MKVVLTDSELAMCYVLGSLRTLIARSYSVRDAKMGGQIGLNGDIDGFMGEYAFCKRKNLFPDIIPAPRSGSYDAVLGKFRFDIKTTRVKSGRLLATLKDNPDVDYYALGIIDGNTVDFVGWASKKDLCKEENITDLGHGKGYALDQKSLNKFHEDKLNEEVKEEVKEEVTEVVKEESVNV